ncbi:hypothetical protein GXW82_02830 [Streptacidiphilus sp. 4-A2]|nr:hypothetical protein [Streptacidiphilus sp. 4-A2]
MFTGLIYHDYGTAPQCRRGPGVSEHRRLGGVASGRVAYTLGLEGPR